MTRPPRLPAADGPIAAPAHRTAPSPLAAGDGERSAGDDEQSASEQREEGAAHTTAFSRSE